MTAPNLLDELEKIVALSEKATPGEWYADEPMPGFRRFIVADCGPIGKVYPRDQKESHGTTSMDDARFIAEAANFLRTHAPALSDMAKRMEAAERLVAVARRVPSWTGRTVPEGCCSDVEFNDAIEAYDAAIDATQEGAG